MLEVSKTLSSTPLLLFTPNGQGPTVVDLQASSPTVWTGTLTVTTSMATGTGTFTFQGADLVGNVGQILLSGSTYFVDTLRPTGSIALSPASPLKAGAAQATLTLSKDAAAAPNLSFVGAASSTVTLSLAGGRVDSDSAISTAPGRAQRCLI